LKGRRPTITLPVRLIVALAARRVAVVTVVASATVAVHRVVVIAAGSAAGVVVTVVARRVAVVTVVASAARAPRAVQWANAVPDETPTPRMQGAGAKATAPTATMAATHG